MSADGWITLYRGQATIIVPAARVTAIVERRGSSYTETLVFVDGKEFIVDESGQRVRTLVVAALEAKEALNRSTNFKVPEPFAPPSAVNHPPHYNTHPSGVECIRIVEHFNFNLGNAIKYIWRAGEKDTGERATALKEDLEKARWYIDRELKRLDEADTKAFARRWMEKHLEFFGRSPNPVGTYKKVDLIIKKEEAKRS